MYNTWNSGGGRAKGTEGRVVDSFVSQFDVGGVLAGCEQNPYLYILYIYPNLQHISFTMNWQCLNHQSVMAMAD